ncbi:hypothetical protein EYF80_038067 [Liparis tanakae]|uniref:Uncharacterized protein n=1 Tax=Liparis tanakae TaxID=230148 RepID=A0A4Z2GDS7_9TELE|nr:hypothetical protein EYF80_038067 [Liparis tanakae]
MTGPDIYTTCALGSCSRQAAVNNHVNSSCVCRLRLIYPSYPQTPRHSSPYVSLMHSDRSRGEGVGGFSFLVEKAVRKSGGEEHGGSGTFSQRGDWSRLQS